MMTVLISMFATIFISCYPFLTHMRLGLYLERLRIGRDVKIELNANSLNQTASIFTPVFLGVAFIKADPKLQTSQEMFDIAIFLLWIANSLWIQRQPAAMLASLKEQPKDIGALRGQLGLFGLLIACTVYLPWLRLWLVEPLFGMMGVVLLIDLVLQALLCVILWQRYRPA